MKYHIISSSEIVRAISRHLDLEGDEVVEDPGQADFCLTATPVIDKEKKYPKIIGGHLDIPQQTLPALRYITSPGPEEFIVFKWFNGEWMDQTLIGIPLVGMMNGDLGKDLSAGLASRYIENDKIYGLFHREELEGMLREMNYTGFVSICVRMNNGSPLVVRLILGVPFCGMLNALEGVSGKLSSFLTDPFNNPLLESWVAGIVLSRFPFPFQIETERVFINGLTPEVEKHFWTFNVGSFRKSFFTESTIIGYATSWSPMLNEANRRTLRTCKTIKVEFKQYRTDLAFMLSRKWAKLKEELETSQSIA